MAGIVGDEAIKKLYSAAAEGDLDTIQQLLQQNSYLLHLVSFPCSRNLLHIATMHRQPDIVREILSRNPQLAEDSDSQKWSPLHIAAAQGHVEIASKLLSRAPKMLCSRDGQDMNPIHVAAMNGHAEILKMLLGFDRASALERVYRGKTALHLCAKHGQLDALKVLVEEVEELVGVRDDDGENVLHLAIRCKHLPIIKYLVLESNKIDKNARNSQGFKPGTMMLKSFSGDKSSEVKEIRSALYTGGPIFFLPSPDMKQLTDMIMVVAVLIATMAYQSIVSPPGGVWQENSSSHTAGEAVMASHYPRMYKKFVRANTTAFISSLVSIFLLSTGLPRISSRIMFLVVCTVWVSLAAIAVSYGASLKVITPHMKPKSLDKVIRIVAGVSTVIGFYGIAFVRTYIFG